MIGAFRRWAFAPVDTAPMAALRIACGLLSLGWVVSLLPDLDAFLADDGLTRQAVDGSRGWWTLDLVSPYAAVALLVAASVALTLGWHTRVAAPLVAVLLLVIQRRDVYVLNSGDLLLRLLAIYVSLMPAGEVWSLDARRRGRSAARAPWGLRMLQIQISVVYFFSVVAKLHGDTWQDGSAVGRAVQLGDLQRVLVPHAIATSVTASALLTYGTILIEGALVFGLWLPRFRWWAMAAGVSIHLGIEATLLIGWFSLTIIACYLAFVPPEVLRRVVAQVGERLGRPVAEPLPVPVVAPGPPPAEPVPAAVASAATSPYPVGVAGQHQGEEVAHSIHLRLTPVDEGGVAAEEVPEPDHGTGEDVEPPAGVLDDPQPEPVLEPRPDPVEHDHPGAAPDAEEPGPAEPADGEPEDHEASGSAPWAPRPEPRPDDDVPPSPPWGGPAQQ